MNPNWTGEWSSVKAQVRWSVPSFDPCCPLTCSTCSLTLWTPGCHFITPCSHISVSTVWTLEFTSSHLAAGWPSQQVAVWPTLGAASCTGVRPAALHVEMERVSIVFNAIYNPGRRGEEEGSWSQCNSRAFSIITGARRQPGNVPWELPLAETHVGLNTRRRAQSGGSDTWDLWTSTYPYLGLTGWLRDTLWIQMAGARR